MKLRTRLSVAFVVVALPGIALSVLALGRLDQLVRDEIELRTTQVLAETQRLLDEEAQEIVRIIETLATRDPGLETHGRGIEGEVRRALEAWALAVSAARRLDVLAVVSKTPGGAELVSSAHLPTAVGDSPPPLAAGLPPGETRYGLALELVEGNPPERVPALIAVHVPASLGRAWVYGGRRLDQRLLGRIARMGNARLVLEVPGRPPEVYPAEAREGGCDHIIPLERIDGGEAARLSVAVDTQRLVKTRKELLWLSSVLGATALGVALLAAGWLSGRITRPIGHLAHAAERIAAGDLDVEVGGRAGSDEVGALVLAFARMTRELREARTRIQRAERVAAWREVARRLAHEIKNPLSPMQLGMQNLRKAWVKQHPKLGEILEESTASVLEAVRSLDRLVEDFSSFARLPAPALGPVPPTELLAQVVRLYEGRVRVDLAGVERRGLPTAWADRDQVVRALVNLVKNAVEAVGADGEVWLDAFTERRGAALGVVFEVRDDGPGMAGDVRERALDVYFTTKPTGTGLGLAIVARTVEEHGGTLDIDSAPGEGTKVRVWIPAGGETESP